MTYLTQREQTVEEKRFYSVKEAAELLAVSHDTVSRLIERKALPAVRVSERIIRIPAPALDAYAAGTQAVPRRVVHRKTAEPPHVGVAERRPDLDPA